MLITNKQIEKLRVADDNGEGTMSDEEVMYHIRDRYEKELGNLCAEVDRLKEREEAAKVLMESAYKEKRDAINIAVEQRDEITRLRTSTKDIACKFAEWASQSDWHCFVANEWEDKDGYIRTTSELYEEWEENNKA
jgi:hypothetical protein